MEFFVNLGDWPLEKRKPSDRIHPIFSWCGSNNTRDIVMPTYDLTESVLETMGRYGEDMIQHVTIYVHESVTDAEMIHSGNILSFRRAE